MNAGQKARNKYLRWHDELRMRFTKNEHTIAVPDGDGSMHTGYVATRSEGARMGTSVRQRGQNEVTRAGCARWRKAIVGTVTDDTGSPSNSANV